jgi:C4-dicarboxylate transporter DctM subunit
MLAVGFGILVLAIVAGLPLYVSLLGTSIFLFRFYVHLSADSIVTAMLNSVDSIVLLAVPYFIFVGILAERTSLATRLTDVMIAIVGRFRGGTPIAALLADEFFGAISGSSPASTAAVGKTMYPLIARREGEKLALGLVTSGGAIAVVTPPSIAMILYGSVGSVPVSSLFAAGIIPALLIAVIVGAYLVVRCQPTTLPRRAVAVAAAEILQALVRGGLVLLMPLLVLGGIYSGVITPSEAGAVAAAYALAIALLAYRDLTPTRFLQALRESTRLTGQIFILLAAGGAFAQALILGGTPQSLAQSLSGLSPLMFLLLFNVVLLLAGMLLDPPAAIVVLTPIVIPIAQQLEIDLVHLGVILAVNIAIGMFMPPFGLNLFVAQSVIGKRMEEVVASCVPFFLLYLVALGIVTYVPGLYMWLPAHMQP